MIRLLRHAVLAMLLCAITPVCCGAAQPTALKSAAVMELELIDDMSAYEDPAVIDAENRRITLTSEALRRELDQRGLYRVLDNRPAADLIAGLKARENLRDCHGCEIDIGKALGADVIVIGWVQKVSNLILNINLQVKDVRTGEMLYAKSVDLRSNTDDSWLRGIRYLLTNMAEENH
jgi:Protein of unknown function (DUF2380)